MMDYTKSKFSGDTFFWGIFSMVWLIFGSIMIGKLLRNYSLKVSDSLVLLLLIALFYLLINFLKHIKIIKIKGNELRYYSILKPFGKLVCLSDYTGKIVLTESGSRGSYRVVYLIDKQNKTAFKIMELHYKNFDEINRALNINIIKFYPSIGQYFKLLFFERIAINNTDLTNNNIINIIIRFFTLISILGTILFTLSILIKRF
ncbi:hypothetical protein VUJ46_02540 [Chryseobacterium sp. MYb264]|uniref:hypothetical protein n=1 Tax=Chryseobacterium sp. MYb264 TaxID=2745153 RepID=UPI002E0D2CD5|nr:hypothetical protein VUJ46_02540 [Chryseobacterium sp. MYb264]